MDEDEGQVGYEASEAGYERTAIIDDGLLSFICKAFALCFDSYFKIIFFSKAVPLVQVCERVAFGKAAFVLKMQKQFKAAP